MNGRLLVPIFYAVLGYRMPRVASSPNQINLLSLTEDGLASLVKDLNWPAYRSIQILRWLYQRRVRSVDEMTNLSVEDRKRLAARAVIGRPDHCRILRASDGTAKLLVALNDGLTVETVLIPDDERLTLCVSTQVGCTLDCNFCLTGTMGLRRNLKAYEIVEQVLTAQDHLRKDERITNLVFMGMGEPLANVNELSDAVRRLTNKTWGLTWSARRITVSTAGLASRMRDIAPLGVNLAISLNATTEAQRDSLMPGAQRISSLKALLAACRRYPLPPGRRLTFEYVLLAGVNDQENDARRLAQLLRGMTCKVNLIPFNEFQSSPYRRPSDVSVLAFQSIIRRAGIDAFIRKSRGREVLGACGQLGTLPASVAEGALTQIESHC
ncbi:Dual-specificity RNA methyltransferase RlmN [Nitrospira sp. KM1]|uniref:23S rRNA (adenine(2503)-C(2))-methyltransferase RlmN n=1 Tax=Nitrospira sp. KM1 TaxID=1936990 RepID=UPI0013A771C7|nr:23S rRNA (adenine(2503)-C(2))-methyltransferase RlmN [Nitrospira sp. KM1]BCA54731.1 Dual-specificity RNA methyltransferase RlmN [Nitrospira sp. KM1]